ncbi:MAG: rod shape-determining protein MreC [Nitrospirota bacterium]
MSKAKKRFIIFLALFSFALAVMSYQHGRRPSSFLQAVSYPFDLLNRLAADVSTTARQARAAFEENKRLRSELAQLLLERQQYREIMQENRRLKELLALKESEHRAVTAARVVARGYDRLLNTAVIDKGKADGVEKGMAVITTKGLIGKVYSVRDAFSEVLLLNDSNFSVAVRLQNSRREGIVSGTGYGYCLLKYVAPEETVERGEVVVTSGFDGLFPEGIPVGVVSRVKKEGVEFFQYVEVVPFQPSDTTEEVILLKRAESPGL